MTGKTHNAISFASLVTLAVFFPPVSLNLLTLFAAVVGNIVGTLAPDLDQASNRLWDLLPGGDYAGRIFRPLFLGHRSLSHSLLGLGIFWALINWLIPRLINPSYLDVNLVIQSMLVGFIAHLFADGVTEEGVPLLFPLKLKFGFPPIQSWRMKTGRWFENLVVLPGVIVYLIWFVLEYRVNLVSILQLVRS